MERRCLRSLLVALLLLLAACGNQERSPGLNRGQQDPNAPASPQKKQQSQAKARAEAEKQRAQAQERCLQERPGVEAQMAALRRAELQLALVKEDIYVPLPPPEPWNESRESRFRREDRDADWQRYLQAQEAWQRREQSHRARWRAQHQERLERAQERLDGQARSMRSRHPDLFTGPQSIEFNPQVVHRLLHCQG